MKTILIKPDSPLRKLLPFLRKLRDWAWKFYDRIGVRCVISGGMIRFMDTKLDFPEGVGLNYTTSLFWNGPDAYEAPTSRTIALLAGKSKLFLDIGSNIGIYAVYVGVKFPQVKVVAFEPVPAIWEKNRRFHRANKLSDQTAKNIALSDQNGAQKLFLPVFDTGVDDEETATLNANSWQAHAEKVEVIEIQCLTLDTFAAQNSLPAGSCCVKIDVEGFESAVLRGGKKFFSERRPWIVCELLPREDYDPATKTLRNNNQMALTVIAELDYVAYAITTVGFFRMNATDFSRPRSLKDFLLIPREKSSGTDCFLTLENVGEIFAA
jgi:FkbM family methyltransferase